MTNNKRDSERPTTLYFQQGQRERLERIQKCFPGKPSLTSLIQEGIDLVVAHYEDVVQFQEKKINA